MRLSYKYGLIITLLITTVTAILTVTTVQREKQVILDQIEQKGMIIAEVLAQTSLTPLLNHDYGTLRVYCEAIAGDTDVVSVGILDQQHIIKMHTDLDMLGLPAELGADGDPMLHELVTPIRIESDVVGYIHLVLSVRRALREAELFRTRNIQVALLAVIVGILIAVLMSRLITTPINKLARGAAEISSGNLDWEIDIRSSDEVGTLAEAFRYMTRRLKHHIHTRIKSEKMAMIGRLSSGLAHEIRNPLEPIKGAASMLKDTHSDDAVVQRYAHIIEEEVDTLSTFLNNFLDYARMREPEFSEMSLNVAARQVCDLLHQLLNDRAVEFEIELDPDLPPISADPNQIKQILMNILMNAIQAVGDSAGRIRVTSRIDEGVIPLQAVLEVYDTGGGIPPETMEHIFDPFYTTRVEGTGLGLAISQTLVEQNDGIIRIESGEGVWTRVRIAFPVREPAEGVYYRAGSGEKS